MRWLTTLWRNLARRDDVDRELDAELRATLDLLIEEKVAAGMPSAAAERAARLELGGIESIKEHVRDVRVGAPFDSVLHDVRWAARLLARYPLFTLTAALSLAIGIGATPAVFTITNGLLLRTATGVAEPDRLVDITRVERDSGPGFVEISFPALRDIRERATTLQAAYGYRLQPDTVSLRIDAEEAGGAFATMATNNFFTTLGVRAAAGRLFDPVDDERPGISPALVLSHRFRQRRFQGDPTIVGRTVFVNGVPATVIGVVDASFRGLSLVDPDLWVPVAMVKTIVADAGPNPLIERAMKFLQVGARLKNGVSRAQASAQLAQIGATLQREFPVEAMAPGPPGTFDKTPSGFVWSAETSTPIPYGVRMLAGGFLGLLMAVISVVLVIACTNLAGVLLARAAARRREIAVRTAIGAGRWRLVRLLLTETVLLFTLGGLAGLALAQVLTALLVGLLPAFPVPINLSTPLDGRVVAFALGLSFVAAVLSGLAPALHAARTDVITALKDDTQGPSDRLRLRSLFVILQVACSVVLVVVAGLLVRGLDRALATNRGFNPRGVDVASIHLTQAGYTQATGLEFTQRVLAAVRAIPGVDAATIADRAPEPGLRPLGDVVVPGRAVDGPAPPFNWTIVAPGYFETLAISRHAGRDFTDADHGAAERVVILGDAAAQWLFGPDDPIGRYVLLTSNLKSRDGRASPPPQARVVGVVGDIHFGGPGSLAVYVPLAQRYWPQLTVLVHHVDEASVAVELRRAIAALDPNVPVIAAQPLSARADGPVQTQLRIASTVAATVGVLGLLLAGVGIYGVTAYAVAQRTREIGVRLSLGASRADVIRMVLRDGLRLVGFGAALGLLFGLGAGRLLSSSRFGLPQFDPITLTVAVVLLTVVGLVACYVPVRRAASIRAMEALRYE